MRLFKYYSPKKYNFSAIAQQKLFFSHPSNLNDPYDTTILNIKAYHDFCQCLQIDEKTLKANLNKHAICCFSKGEKANNRHLWAFYASNYEGFAVEYDEELIGNSAQIIALPLQLFDVDYREKPLDLDSDDTFIIKEAIPTEGESQRYSVDQCVNGYMQGDSILLDRLFTELHLQKETKIWKEENECRLIIGNIISNKIGRRYFQRIGNKGVMYKLPAPAIKSITIGYRTSPKNKRRITKIASKLGVQLFQATPCTESGCWIVKIDEIDK